MIGSFFFLHVTRTAFKAWMSSNFGGIPPLTSELVSLEHLKNQTISLLALPAFNFDWIFFILAGYKDNNIVSNEFENIFMTCCQVSDRCPLGYLFRKTKINICAKRLGDEWILGETTKIQNRVETTGEKRPGTKRIW